MADIGAVRKELLAKFGEHLVGSGRVFRQRLSKQLVDDARLDVGEDALRFDTLQVLGDKVDNLVGNIAEFVSVHS